jgi:hypothetical protein
MAAPIPKHFRKDWPKLEGASPNWVAQIQNEVVIDKKHYNWAFPKQILSFASLRLKHFWWIEPVEWAVTLQVGDFFVNRRNNMESVVV